MAPQGSQSDQMTVTITKYPLGSKYYVLNTSFSTKKQLPFSCADLKIHAGGRERSREHVIR